MDTDTIKVDVAVLKEQSGTYKKIFDKLDITMERLKDLIDNSSKMLADHDQRFSSMRASNDLFKEETAKIDLELQKVKKEVEGLHRFKMYLVGMFVAAEVLINLFIHFLPGK